MQDNLVRCPQLSGFGITERIVPENTASTLLRLRSLQQRCNDINKKCDPNCPVAAKINELSAKREQQTSS